MFFPFPVFIKVEMAESSAQEKAGARKTVSEDQAEFLTIVKNGILILLSRRELAAALAFWK